MSTDVAAGWCCVLGGTDLSLVLSTDVAAGWYCVLGGTDLSLVLSTDVAAGWCCWCDLSQFHPIQQHQQAPTSTLPEAVVTVICS